MAISFQNPFANDSSLKLYLPFDGSSNDYTGIYNGTDTNISYVTGKINYGANFNGSNSKIVLPIGIESFLTTNFTISFWLNLNSYGTNARIFGNQVNPIKTGQFSILVKDALSDKVEFCFYRGSDLWNTVYTTVAPTLNTWELYTFVKSGTNAYIYKNGLQNSSSTIFQATLQIDNTTPCTFGQFTGGSDLLDGKIDEFIILNRALSSGEVKSLYESYLLLSKFGQFLPTTNTLNYFKFNGNSNNYIGSKTSTETNITYVPGRYGQCPNFNGTNSNIKYTGSQLTNFTVSFWIKTTSPTSISDMYILSQANSTNNGNFDVKFKPDMTISFSYYNGTETEAKSTIALNDGVWHNIVFTRTGSTGYLYIDGNLNVTKTGFISTTISNYYNFIGSHYSGRNWYNGQMDEIIIENKVWTENEVRKYYTNSLGRFAIL